MALFAPHNPVPMFWMEKRDDILLDNYSPFAFIASPAVAFFYCFVALYLCGCVTLGVKCALAHCVNIRIRFLPRWVSLTIFIVALSLLFGILVIPAFVGVALWTLAAGCGRRVCGKPVEGCCGGCGGDEASSSTDSSYGGSSYGGNSLWTGTTLVDPPVYGTHEQDLWLDPTGVDTMPQAPPPAYIAVEYERDPSYD
ncbi:hypothetical protein GGS26DRAFT_590961 [Hypomontagnella submonticulosa]|nr:hypothetical protein GGS26DRAFT_590961 [Hypomontagnella submonticulosa]